MSPSSERAFAPRDGALLDLESLQCIAAVPHRLLRAMGMVLCPGEPGLVLSGLEPEAPLSALGPPGTRRPDSAATGLRLSPGTLLMPDEHGQFHVVEVPEPTFVSWPTRSGSGVEGALVARIKRAPSAAPGGLQVAREDVHVELGFVRTADLERPGILGIAAAVGNGKDWITDLHRIWDPTHPAVELIERRLDELERLIWRAEPEGSVWDRGVLGRNWVRYQTMAAASLQSTRLTLRTHRMTTTERVRLFVALRDQLSRSVQPAATALLQFFRPSDGAGPYAAVLAGSGT